VDEAKAVAWLEDLAARGHAVPVALPQATHNTHYDAVEALSWLAEADAALHDVLPSGHSLLRTWRGVYARAETHVVHYAAFPGMPALNIAGSAARDVRVPEPNAVVHFNQFKGVVAAAARLAAAGHLKSFADTIRAETTVEVLDQADLLLSLSGEHSVPAAVLAGGALETHLLHLCRRHSLSWAGDGSIGKYDGAIAKARNDGTATIYAGTDSGLVGGWGKIRNLAAHDPTNFHHTSAEVRMMVQGIRAFIARVP
jgi:hypothetical protein